MLSYLVATATVVLFIDNCRRYKKCLPALFLGGLGIIITGLCILGLISVVTKGIVSSYTFSEINRAYRTGYIFGSIIMPIIFIVFGIILSSIVASKVSDKIEVKRAQVVYTDPEYQNICAQSSLEAFYIYYRYPSTSTLDFIKKHNSFAGNMIFQVEHKRISKKNAIEQLRLHDAQQVQNRIMQSQMQ